MLSATLSAVADRLEAQPVGGYGISDVIAAEPVAWAAMALAGTGRDAAARTAAEWLAKAQQSDGSVGVTAEEQRPAWTTAPAVLAWLAVDPSGYADRIDRAFAWALEQKPWTAPRTRIFGHDTELAGWSWAADTHSWLEPTAFFVKAFVAAGRTEPPRVQEAIRLLVDRLLPRGGANYGNTVVLGQELLQHVQSSGIVAWVLADTPSANHLTATLDYLEAAIEEPTGVASLAYAALGLSAAGRFSERLAEALIAAAPRVETCAGSYKPALYASACQAVLRAEANHS
ncbi:hypothetical protein Pla111_03530 [Botrimarina hoheduenensis]|uniref:Prenyltransferase and squalene oxidase repeat protein n=2 Tax=Botrimarina hoheduenensis TaxID=2528000 RepID=A0A5C5WES9_9BACT|nr:hypothetical protein Pla111_03530 [Botrimarina hoheduenensis]